MLSCLTEAAWIQQAIYRLSVADKKILASLVDFHLFMKVKAVMDQFKDGLAFGGVLSFMQNNFDLLRQLFVDEKPPLTVGMLCLFLEPLQIRSKSVWSFIGVLKGLMTPNFSEWGDSHHANEEATYLHFCSFFHVFQKEVPTVHWKICWLLYWSGLDPTTRVVQGTYFRVPAWQVWHPTNCINLQHRSLTPHLLHAAVWASAP